MSDQPTFRPRILPMPKVGMVVLDKEGYPATVTHFDKAYPHVFFCLYADGHKTWFDAIDQYGWTFEKLEDEAAILMEAAYRADTRPFPESLLEAIEMASEEGDMEADNVLAILIEQHPATVVFALVPHFLRWQAQQEGGAQ